MNLAQAARSQIHNLLLVALTEGKPKNLRGMIDAFTKLEDFTVRARVDVPSLASCLQTCPR